MGVILKEMKKIGADGVDFVSIGNGTIYDSMTKEQIKKECSISEIKQKVLENGKWGKSLFREDREMTGHENRGIINEISKSQAFEKMREYIQAVGSEETELWCEQDKEIMQECLLILFND